ncbi:methyl-accepting chemotaxis protein [uncultured Propionivibrio sp.]|uniref:methyl-accepting chemotaxis protein n=1 Tax=uncultured Propionivibrio sp. TaxID=426737 RepID=UPI0029C09629|nr:methyl-accepting chemotaxis protein [uncultured Propionivibrio sp.]
MKNMTISRRILLMVITSIVGLLAVGLVGLSVSNQQVASIQSIKDDSLASIEVLGEARQAYMEYRVLVYTHLVNSDPAVLQTTETRLGESADRLQGMLKKYEGMLSNDEDKKLLENDRTLLGKYMDLMGNRVIALSKRNEKDAARNLIVAEGTALGVSLRKALGDHMAFNVQNANSFSQRALDTAAHGRVLSISVIVAALAAIGLFGYFLVTNIRQSMNEIQGMVSHVESNLDFTVRVQARRQDEIGMTTQALNRLLDKLQTNLKTIAESAHMVSAASGQMSTASSQVATASHQQSESASDMAATVEEMTVSINHVGERALEANRLSSESGALAQRGELVIGETVTGIRAIADTVNEAATLIHGLEQHSQEISNVVSVIKEVADQTNLLALNAAIEAARAGEQGRGFAVVADEVRKLAERTSASTQEIGTSIAAMRDSAGGAVSSMQRVVEKVGEGVEKAEEANQSIRVIGESSRAAVSMVEEITSAIREQAAATNNIAVQVEKIAQMSEESSAAARHSAETAQQLDSLATEMQSIVSAYKI